jgi:hypothetical protein
MLDTSVWYGIPSSNAFTFKVSRSFFRYTDIHMVDAVPISPDDWLTSGIGRRTGVGFAFSLYARVGTQNDTR